MLEPEEGNGDNEDEDDTEGHEYDEETSDDAEYDTDEEEGVNCRHNVLKPAEACKYIS